MKKHKVYFDGSVEVEAESELEAEEKFLEAIQIVEMIMSRLMSSLL